MMETIDINDTNTVRKGPRRYCSIKFCPNNRGTKCQLFRSPKDIFLRKKWVDSIKMNQPNINHAFYNHNHFYAVCQLHFKSDDIITRNGRKKLRKRRFPTVFNSVKIEPNDPLEMEHVDLSGHFPDEPSNDSAMEMSIEVGATAIKQEKQPQLPDSIEPIQICSKCTEANIELQKIKRAYRDLQWKHKQQVIVLERARRDRDHFKKESERLLELLNTNNTMLREVKTE